MKTLEKSEMLERNKVGRVLTEEGILNQGESMFNASNLCSRVLCQQLMFWQFEGLPFCQVALLLCIVYPQSQPCQASSTRSTHLLIVTVELHLHLGLCRLFCH